MNLISTIIWIVCTVFVTLFWFLENLQRKHELVGAVILAGAWFASIFYGVFCGMQSVGFCVSGGLYAVILWALYLMEQ